MASIAPTGAKAALTPPALWQFHTDVVCLLQRTQRLCLDLAGGRLDEESARFNINHISGLLLKITQSKEIHYWFGQAYITKRPKPEPTNPLLANDHLCCVRIVGDFLEPILAHQIIKTHPPESLTLKVPLALTGVIDLAAVAEIAKYCAQLLNKFDQEDVERLRAEADLAVKLLTKWQKNQKQSAAGDGTTLDERAVAMKVAHADWTDQQIADALNCHVKSLYKRHMVNFKKAKAAMKSGREDYRHGEKPDRHRRSSNVDRRDSDDK